VSSASGLAHPATPPSVAAQAAAMTGVMPVLPAAGETLIGVAIAVPQPWAAELEGWRSAFGDPLGATVPAHVTLVPPTAVPTGAMDRVVDHLRRTTEAAAPFTIRLRGTGSFRPVSPVVYVRLASGGPECTQLEDDVRAGVLGTQRRFPFHPHVTVAQLLDEAALDRAEAELAGYEASFDVTEVGLFTHGRDGVWRASDRFPLGG